MDLSTKMKTESEKKHYCQECGSSFSRPYRLIQHMLLHKNIKAFACGEENCNKSYTSKSHLDRHIQTVHIKPNFQVLFRCPQCLKIFSNRQNLKRHVKEKHLKHSVFTCDVCHLDFKKKHLLSSHICDFCDKEFATRLEKKKHLKCHKTYDCDQCDMAFSQWSKYQKHKQIHRTKEFICNECGRKFKERQHIVRHVKIHMSLPVFKCWYKDCNRLYSRHSNLRQHIRIKHLDMTHPCGICGAKLSTKAKLQQHLVTHTKETVKIKQPTLAEGRKVRKDKGIPKSSTALKIAGLRINIEPEEIEAVSENGLKESIPQSHEDFREISVINT